MSLDIFLCLFLIGAALRRRRKGEECRDRLEDRTRVEVASHNFSAGGPRLVVVMMVVVVVVMMVVVMMLN